MINTPLFDYISYMQFVLEGILFGLTLAILMGPIFIAVTQATLQHGTREGLAVTSGVWVSDMIIITLTYIFVQRLANVVESESFKLYLGITGGLVLIIFGISAYLKEMKFNTEKKKMSIKSFSGFWLKGFLVNTVNPFTFIFWIGTISTYVIGRNVSNKNTIIFMSSIMITIIVTDALKVFMAKLIRQKLGDEHINLFSKIAGVGLFLFGLFLIARVVLN